MILKIEDKLASVMNLIHTGYVRGYEMPFKCLNELYTRKLGHTTYIVGHEFNGKTEFELEIDVWLAKKYKLKTAIFTPETGSVEDIILEIAHKWCGKSLMGNYVGENEKMKILAEVSQYFFIIHSPDDEISFDELFDSLDVFENENNIFCANVVIDPFNEMKFDFNGLPRDVWLEKQLGMIRRKVRKDKRHITIITHPIESDRLYHKDGYLLPPSRKQYAGGQAWGRKGESMICINRPPAGLDEHSNYHDENECNFIMQKAKPKGIGKIGEATLYFDWKRSAYYEFQDGRRYYAGELIEADNKPKEQDKIEEHEYTKIKTDEPF